MQNKNLKNYNRSKSEILRLLYDIVVFRLVAYLLNMVCLILRILYKISYIRFGIILTQFCLNFSRQEHQIDVLYLSFNAWDSQVSAYTPFHFTVPLMSKMYYKIENLYLEQKIFMSWIRGKFLLKISRIKMKRLFLSGFLATWLRAKFRNHKIVN